MNWLCRIGWHRERWVFGNLVYCSRCGGTHKDLP